MLVAGAGLTGAAVAWLSARAGFETVVVSDERPATQGSALFPGIVRGLGPPESFGRWAHAPMEEREAAWRRENAGVDYLRELLLRARRDVGFRRIVHLAETAPGASGERAERAGRALQEAGFSISIERRNGTGVLVRERDATLDRRRLTFEFLFEARRLGAQLVIPETLHSLGRCTAGAREITLRGGSKAFDAVVWAADHPYPGDPAASSCKRRSMLVQVMDAGAERLELALQVVGGSVSLSPLPGAEDARTLLVRTASEESGRGTFWSEVPRSWDGFRGRARRQRLIETVVGPTPRRFVARERVVSLTGISGWPVASLLGACAEALTAVSSD